MGLHEDLKKIYTEARCTSWELGFLSSFLNDYAKTAYITPGRLSKAESIQLSYKASEKKRAASRVSNYKPDATPREFDGYSDPEKSFMIHTINRRCVRNIGDADWDEFMEALNHNGKGTKPEDHFNLLELKRKWDR